MESGRLLSAWKTGQASVVKAVGRSVAERWEEASTWAALVAEILSAPRYNWHLVQGASTEEERGSSSGLRRLDFASWQTPTVVWGVVNMNLTSFSKSGTQASTTAKNLSGQCDEETQPAGDPVFESSNEDSSSSHTPELAAGVCYPWLKRKVCLSTLPEAVCIRAVLGTPLTREAKHARTHAAVVSSHAAAHPHP